MIALRRHVWGFVVIAGAVIALTLVSFSNGFFKGWEQFVEDLFVFSQPTHKDLVVVAIDSESLQKIGAWPWPREVFAQAWFA